MAFINDARVGHRALVSALESAVAWDSRGVRGDRARSRISAGRRELSALVWAPHALTETRMERRVGFADHSGDRGRARMDPARAHGNANGATLGIRGSQR